MAVSGLFITYFFFFFWQSIDLSCSVSLFVCFVCICIVMFFGGFFALTCFVLIPV